MTIRPIVLRHTERGDSLELMNKNPRTEELPEHIAVVRAAAGRLESAVTEAAKPKKMAKTANLRKFAGPVHNGRKA